MSELPVPEILTAEYLAEVRELSTLPAVGAVEIAISGRSNVGKSTLLNRLSLRKALARTSKTPGRTRGIIFYDLVARWPDSPDQVPMRLVDLPGYGYAQVSKTERHTWGPLIENYVKTRPTLKLFLVLVDARRPVEAEEQQLLEWLQSLGIPHLLVVTKVDKLSATEKGTAKVIVRKGLTAPAPQVALVSATTGEGIGALWAAMQRATRSAVSD